MHIPYIRYGHIVKDVQRKSLWGVKVVQTRDTFRFQAIQIYIQLKLLWKCDGEQLQAMFQYALSAPLPKAYDCVAVYIAGRHTNLVVYGCRPQPATQKTISHEI